MTKRATGWSYNAGERGRNWVRAYEDNRTGIILVEFFESDSALNAPKRKRISLGHRDRHQAKQQADEIAARFGEFRAPTPDDLTLQQLFDKYLGEVTPTKSVGKQKHDRGCAQMFLRFFGGDRKAKSLNVRDWNRFVTARREGSVGPGMRRKPAGDRQVGYDLRWLLAALNWATKAANREGRVLLDFNPLKGLPIPVERNPKRPVLTDGEYQQLLRVASEVNWRFRVALILAHETGHRIGAIRHLRWADVDLNEKRVRWRAESDKIQFDHVTPLSPPAVAALELAQHHRPAIGDAWVLPSPSDDGVPCSRHLMKNWWRKAEDLAGFETVKGRGWHSLRRKFATELKDESLKDLCQLGGWKDPQTILKCYQTADEESMREALSRRQVLRSVGEI